MTLDREEGEVIDLVSAEDVERICGFTKLGVPSLGRDGKFLVGSAVGTREEDKERLAPLLRAGVNVVVVHSSQVNLKYQIDMIKYAKSNYRRLDIIGINVVTMAQAQNLIIAGVDGLRGGGMGSDSFCTNKKVPVVGSGQAKSVYKVANVAKDYDILVVAGEILYFCHIVKAFILDTFAVMMDDFLDCGCEAPEIYEYQVAQGVVGVVADESSVLNIIPNTMQQSVKQGTSSLLLAHNLLRSELLRMERRFQDSCSSHGRFGNLPHRLLDSDADWAGDPVSRKSTSGFCSFLGDTPISWTVKKQHTVAHSSTESEYRALAALTSDIIWLRQLLSEVGLNQDQPTDLYCDNTSAIALANNPVFHARTKHIEIDHRFVRDHIHNSNIRILPITTIDQIADIFTKALSTPRFHLLRNKLTVIQDPSVCGEILDNKDNVAVTN